MLRRLADQFETASGKYAAANGIERDDDWFLLKLQEEMGELTQAWNRLTGRGRSRGRTPEALKGDLADEAPTCSATFCSSPAATTSTLPPQSNGSGCSGRMKRWMRDCPRHVPAAGIFRQVSRN
jgi:hypothetical protein